MPPINGSIGNPDHTREGGTVMFRCDPEDQPIISTCTGTGEWIPSPDEHSCTGVTGMRTSNEFYYHDCDDILCH